MGRRPPGPSPPTPLPFPQPLPCLCFRVIPLPAPKGARGAVPVHPWPGRALLCPGSLGSPPVCQDTGPCHRAMPLLPGGWGHIPGQLSCLQNGFPRTATPGEHQGVLWVGVTGHRKCCVQLGKRQVCKVLPSVGVTFGACQVVLGTLGVGCHACAQVGVSPTPKQMENTEKLSPSFCRWKLKPWKGLTYHWQCHISFAWKLRCV